MSSTINLTCEVLNWFIFFCWLMSFYPQVIMNFLRKSVVGLSLDFVLLNFTTQTMYLVFNTSLFFNPAVQKQYRNTQSLKDKIFTVASHVAFSFHAVLLTSISLFQTAIYDVSPIYALRGNQKVSGKALNLAFVAWSVVAGCFFISLPQHQWLWFFLMFNGVLIVMDVVTYIPQVLMNFKRKSTQGWNVGTVILELLGHVANFTKMALTSLDKGSRTKLDEIDFQVIILSLVTVAFDMIFIIQHFIIYAPKDDPNSEIRPPPLAEADGNADRTVTTETV